MQPNTVETIMSVDEAKALTDRIRQTIADAWLCIVEAYERRAWLPLGYLSWNAYCQTEFAGARLRVPREERQEIVASLRESGLSLRAIESATGVSRNTVMADIIKVANIKVVQTAPRVVRVKVVSGTDGKVYQLHPDQSRESPVVRETYRPPLAATAHTAGNQLRHALEQLERVVADDRFAATRPQIAAKLFGHLTYASGAVAALIQTLNSDDAPTSPGIVSR